jgi:hypothetical protein
VSQPALKQEDAPGVVAELLTACRDTTEAAFRFWGRLGWLAYESLTMIGPGGDEPGPAAQVPTAASRAQRTILIEADAGEAGLGVFLLENTTQRSLSIPISVSPFTARDGRVAQPRLAFRPERITLEPGEQLAVQVAVLVDETLAPGVRYHAEIGVPGLSDARIPIAVCRPTKQARVETRAA